MVIAEQSEASQVGLTVLGHLVRVFLCKAKDVSPPDETLSDVIAQAFTGPHPVNLSGIHIHFPDLMGADRSVWNLSYQDMITTSRLFTTRQL